MPVGAILRYTNIASGRPTGTSKKRDGKGQEMPARRKYWWEEWFSQKLTIVQRGIDYQCSQSAMAQNIRSNASAYGKSVKLTDNGDSFIIEVVGEIRNGVTYACSSK